MITAVVIVEIDVERISIALRSRVSRGGPHPEADTSDGEKHDQSPAALK
jgi:hypothetical protein